MRDRKGILRKVLIFSIFLIISLGCKEEKQIKWWARVQFVDSTYTQENSKYFIDDTVYILFTGEHPHVSVPVSLPIEVRSNLGDYEIIDVCWTDLYNDTSANPRVGKIKTEGSSDYKVGNGILEVNPNGDTIFAFSMAKCFPGSDTAKMKVKRR